LLDTGTDPWWLSGWFLGFITMDLQESQTGFDIYEYIHGSQKNLKNKITSHKTNDYFPILHETHKSF
jgi:hypothetical protein